MAGILEAVTGMASQAPFIPGPTDQYETEILWLLSWALIFAIAFGILEAIDVLEESEPNALVAAVIAFFFMFRSPVSLSNFANSVGIVGAFLIVALLAIMPAALALGEEYEDSWFKKLAAAAAAIIGILILFGQGITEQIRSEINLGGISLPGEGNLLMIFILGLLGGMIYWVVKE